MIEVELASADTSLLDLPSQHTKHDRVATPAHWTKKQEEAIYKEILCSDTDSYVDICSESASNSLPGTIHTKVRITNVDFDE